MLDYAGYQWQVLDALDAREVAAALGEAFVEAADLPSHQRLDVLLRAMVRRHARQGGGLPGLRWIMFDAHGPCGWTGIVAAPGGTWETATYLHPRAWGRGLNLRCKSLLWQSASELASVRRMVISIDVANVRSIRANRRLFPHLPMQTGPDPCRGRISTVIEVDRPPVGYMPLDDLQLQHAQELIAASAQRVS
jgi:hypothetical protein